MKINQAALDLVKEFEGLKLTAYQDPVGIWTIGYGTTAAAGAGVTPIRGMTITAAQAEKFLLRGLEKFAAQIEAGIKVPVTENQFGALVSLAYNIGPGAFLKSTLLKKLNARDYAGASGQFLVWNKAKGKVLKGLTRRREAERALFLKPAAAVFQQIAADRPGFLASLITVIAHLLRRKK